MARIVPGRSRGFGESLRGAVHCPEPDLAFVLEDGAGVCGYVLAALDSARFYERLQAEWLPSLCARHPDPEGDPATWTRYQRL